MDNSRLRVRVPSNLTQVHSRICVCAVACAAARWTHEIAEVPADEFGSVVIQRRERVSVTLRRMGVVRG